MKVTLVELPVFAGVIPLASGYIEAYSRKQPLLESSFRFEKISLPVSTPYDDVLARLEESDAAVYGFSCYVWNTGLVRRLVAALRRSKPDVYVVLGGPQVMHQAEKYLSPSNDRTFICNGEGERTFSNVLSELLAPQPDFTRVKGLSLYSNGQLVTTEPEPRIGDLSEIPSPFLEGLFEKGKAATGSKVYRYDETRVQQELEWISQSGCLYLFIADANWGMLTRDVALSHRMVQLHEQYGTPLMVYFCGSKNTRCRP
jgi:radical SAM superfamily enzyme YgiQ (UPF0313 family)